MKPINRAVAAFKMCAATQLERYNLVVLHKQLHNYRGLKRFRRFNENCVVIQVKSEPPLVNQDSNLKIHANDIVPFARKQALVAVA